MLCFAAVRNKVAIDRDISMDGTERIGAEQNARNLSIMSAVQSGTTLTKVINYVCQARTGYKSAGTDFDGGYIAFL